MSSNYINVTASSVNLTLPNPFNVTVKNTQLKIYGNTNATILNFPTTQKVYGNTNATLTNFPKLVNTTEYDSAKTWTATYTANNQRLITIDTNLTDVKGFVVYINHTFVGTLSFYHSHNRKNNLSLSCINLAGGAQATSTTTSSAWYCPANVRYLMLGTSAWTSGTMQVTVYSSSEQAPPVQNEIVVTGSGTYSVTKSGTWAVDGSTASTYVSTIDKQHYNLESGRGWDFNDVISLASGGNVTYSINVTGTANRQPHFYFAMAGEQTINCTFWEAPTYTAGSLMTQRQRNRNTGTTLSPSMYIYKTPSLTAKGTYLYNYIAFATGSNKGVSGQDRDINEWVLKSSTKYLLICKNAGSSSGLFNIIMEYYYTA